MMVLMVQPENLPEAHEVDLQSLKLTETLLEVRLVGVPDEAFSLGVADMGD